MSFSYNLLKIRSRTASFETNAIALRRLIGEDIHLHTKLALVLARVAIPGRGPVEVIIADLNRCPSYGLRFDGWRQSK